MHYSSIKSKEVASDWLNFSHFMPSFLNLLSRYTLDSHFKKSLLNIMNEEEGFLDGEPHYILFQRAINEIGLNIQISERKIVRNLENGFLDLIKNVNDKEAFVLGVNYGLEITAQENIQNLLKYCSFDHRALMKLKNSSFFQIHFINEINHINSCNQNFENIRNQKREVDFLKGSRFGQKFWKSFWEKHYE